MPAPQGAMSARVSSAQQAEAQTLARHGAAWRERGASEGLPVPSAMPGRAEGDSGATLGRLARERWRDVVAARGVERLALHAPERLARPDASQVLRVDAC